MKTRVDSYRLWTPVLATAKLAWGKLTRDQWLQLEGRRLKYPGQMKNSTAFAQVRLLSPQPLTRVGNHGYTG